MRVAIVHDWFVGGGAELVVEQLHKIYPEAPIYTSYCTEEWQKRLDNKVIASYMQHWPFSRLRKFLPVLRQRWFSKLDLSTYDLVISSSGNGEAKFIKLKKPAVHVCYCHSPTHFYWRHHDYYKNFPGFGPQILVSLSLKILIKWLRNRDYQAAQSVDYFIANSRHIQSDIMTFYGRDSVVIWPPVNVQEFNNELSEKRRGFITIGRQVPYKRVDLIVDACTKLNLPLKVIGSGPEHERLVKRAGPTVELKSWVPFEEVISSLKSSEAFILAAFEDFGITPVEALAAGTPVIAYQAGGALDYIDPGKNGDFFKEQTVESLSATLQKFKPKKYKYSQVQKSAAKFSTAEFRKNIKKFIGSVV